MSVSRRQYHTLDIKTIDYDDPYSKAIYIAKQIDPSIEDLLHEGGPEIVYMYHFDIFRLIYVSFKIQGDVILGDALRRLCNNISDVTIETHYENKNNQVCITSSLYTIFTMAEISDIFYDFKNLLDDEKKLDWEIHRHYDITEGDKDIFIADIKRVFTKPSDMYATIYINENNASTYEFIKNLRSTCCNRNVVTACFGKNCVIITAPRYAWENTLRMVVTNKSEQKYHASVIKTLRNQWSDFLSNSATDNFISCKNIPSTKDIEAGLAFDVALPVCINGALIARTSWPNGDMIRYLPAGNYFKQCESQNTYIPAMFIRMHENGPDEVWLPNTDDLIAHDWIAYDSVK